MDTAEDTNIIFASTMRALLAEIASTVTQARLDNLHKGLDIPGKPTQLVEPENKPLMDQEALDALIAKKPATKRQRVQPFRKRQQNLQEAFMNILVYKQCRKYLRFHWNGRCFQFRVLPFGLSLSPLVFTKILRPVLEWARSKWIRACISRRLSNHGRIQLRVPNKHALNLFQSFADWIQAQSREVVDYAISVDHPLRIGNQLQGNIPKGSIQQDPGSATRGQQTTERWTDDHEAQKPSSVNIEFMDIDSNFDETSNPEPVLLEESANVMEWSLVLARDAGNGYFYRRQRLSLGNSSGPPLLLWNMEPQGNKTPYQHERTVDSAVCTEAQERSGKISVGLHRQHNHTRLCQEIREHNLPRITEINREDLIPLPQNQQSPTDNIR
ncbi:hypothetical protein AYI70_g9907, partial [Smittium culicis]